MVVGPDAALMLVGVGGIGAGLTITQQRAGLARAARDRATDIGQTLATRVAAYRADLTAQLEKAASTPELRAALDNRVDARTFEDLFQTEEWWEDFRNHAVAVIRGDRLVVARGIEPGVAKKATERVPSAQAVDSAGQLLAVAAGTYRLRKSGDDFTVVLGRRIDDAVLAALRAPNSAAVAISDGRRVRASAGDAAGTAEATRFIGSEAAGTFVDPAGEWAGAAVAFGDGIWLLGIGEKGARPLPEPAAWGGAGLGALLFIAGVIPLVRRRRSATVPMSTTGGGVSAPMPESAHPCRASCR